MKKKPKPGETVYNRKGEPSMNVGSPDPGPTKGVKSTYHEGRERRADGDSGEGAAGS